MKQAGCRLSGASFALYWLFNAHLDSEVYVAEGIREGRRAKRWRLEQLQLFEEQVDSGAGRGRSSYH